MDPDSLPPRDAEAAGMPWLPRLIEKARGRLRGELDPDVTYPCPLDRQFLKEHDIHPAELLNKVWDTVDDTEALITWVAQKSKALQRKAL